MNNETDTNEALKGFLLEVLQESKEFVLVQAPEVVQELVLFNRLQHTIMFVILFLLTTVFLVTPYRLARKRICDGPDIFMVSFITLALSGIPFIFAMSSGLKALQWWVAPRVALLEYARSLF